MTSKFLSKSHPVQRVSVEEHEDGRRLDNFLLSRLDAPRSAVYRWIRTGQVRVNRGRATPDRRLVAGDEVRVPPHKSDAQMEPATPPEIPVPVLHEDADILIVNKPSGLAVHGGSRLRFGLIQVLRQARGAEDFLELAHRLDRGSSGCLILARNRPALLGMQRQLRMRKVRKRYRILVHGEWPSDLREVSDALHVRRRRAKGRKVVADPSGRQARTQFRVLERLGCVTLLEVEIETGRTHQIRVHTSKQGHPIIGDVRYGQREVNQGAQAEGFRRLFLHAHSLEFCHPVQGMQIRATAPLDDSCKAYLTALRDALKRGAGL